MHEMSLLRDLMRKIDRVAAEHGSRRVRAVRLRLGALAHISPDHLREHFRWAAAGGIAEGAALTIEVSSDVDEPGAQSILLESVEVED
ncbi:MAG: hydrogenase maturation nickel metallochaperone HypA [Deltaproteobacteria bacterium]|nr:hydrogenase maturation nickel metallochaperone HypA [Deltaproteobacteria bacterium]